MKKLIKTIGIVLLVIMLPIITLIACLGYEVNYKKKAVGESLSADGRYTLTVYQIGEPAWPFGPVDGKLVLEKDDKKISECPFVLYDDGGGISYREGMVVWNEQGAKVLISGSEQEDKVYVLSYDGSCHGETLEPWFTEEEVISRVREMYGERITLVNTEDTGYVFQAKVVQPEEGNFEFWVEQRYGVLQDNYLNAYFRYAAECYFEKSGQQVEWLSYGSGAAKQYSPYFKASIYTDSELVNFCGSICDYVEYCIGVEAIAAHAQYFQSMRMAVAGKDFTFLPSFSVADYERTALYNELYTKLDEMLHETNAAKVEYSGQDDSFKELSPEVLDYYMGIEASCRFLTDEGLEYRMIAVDRALGSNYYVLLVLENEDTCSFVNLNPYNGSGGEARWITFLNDNLGFSCLAHSAGSYGSLYRTEDGGKSWNCIEYPSANAKLPDGTFYNPYVMPEKIYEEGGQIFMEVGQGADGDYYENNQYCHGLYRSSDEGVSWEFAESIPGR